MKNVIKFFFAVVLIEGSISCLAQGSKGDWTISSDFYNRYIWRGSDYGNSPVVQPTIKYSNGGLLVGFWGSYSLSSNTTATEADLFLGYAFKNGLSLLLTDYYFPSEPGNTGNYFDYHNAHTFEATVSQAIGKFSLAGNYYFANADNDVYFEAGYNLNKINLFLGAGDKSYSKNGDFNVVNVGISAVKSIPFTEKFSLPLTGKVILNPNKEQIFLVIGFTL
jgi:hypothetical protein